jgi:3-methyladenine DNA glycosylase AlkD
MPKLLPKLLKNTKSLSNPIYAKTAEWFFKTGKGDYSYGDKFLGLKVPTCRQITKKYVALGLPDLDRLIWSKYHEERLIALLILVEKFSQADEKEKTKIYKFYLAHTKWINNWDLVDLSTPKIVGAHLFSTHQNRKVLPPDKKYPILFNLVKSKNLWERRIAIVSTFYFIKQYEFKPTLALAELLLKDEHDLIHKSVGWMLREVGKKSTTSLTLFLKKHYKTMPRTMLRYAIEKFPEEIRQGYLSGQI